MERPVQGSHRSECHKKPQSRPQAPSKTAPRRRQLPLLLAVAQPLLSQQFIQHPPFLACPPRNYAQKKRQKKRGNAKWKSKFGCFCEASQMRRPLLVLRTRSDAPGEPESGTKACKQGLPNLRALFNLPLPQRSQKRVLCFGKKRRTT